MLLFGRIIMAPQADGSYQAKSFLMPLNLSPTAKSRKPRSVGTEASEVVEKVSCAGGFGAVSHGRGVALGVRLAA